jgi:DNA-binding NarL/FixJ family response regulator
MEPTKILPIVAVLSLVSVEYGGWALLTYTSGRASLADWQKGFFRAGHRRRLASLTNREREVAVAVGEGRANAEIAHDLHMSVATVKAHVSRLLTKLGVDNRVQIAILIHDAASGFDEQNSTT